MPEQSVAETYHTTSNQTIKNKGENKMNFTNNFKFGPYTNANVKMSLKGLAIKSNDRFVNYKNGVTTDVTDFLINDMSNGIFVVSVGLNKINVGDIVLHNDTPMFVEELHRGEDNKILAIKVVDIGKSERKEIVPITNVFGFNFYTKLVSMFDGMDMNASEDNPFGNEMMLMMMGNGNMDMNSMLLYSMMTSSKDKDMSKMAMLMSMMNGDKNGNNNMLPILLMGGLKDLF